MKKNIILELDSFYIDRVVAWLSETKFYQHYRIFVVVKQYNYDLFVDKLSHFSELKCFTYKDIFSYQPKSKVDLNLYFDFNKAFFNDHLTARFLDRAGYFPKYGIGVQNAYMHYKFSSFNMLAFLKEHNIEFLCLRNTPHNLDEWLLVKGAQFLDIDFYSLEDYIFPWLFTIKKETKENSELVFTDLDETSKEELHQHISNCVKRTSGKYEDAIPTYEKDRLGKGILKFYNPFSNIKFSLQRPHQFMNKTRNFFYYKKHSKVLDLKQTDYVVFLLHFQPERSTLPEGYEFVDQFYTIKIISEMLPKGVKLLVKEHPSMFTKVCEPKARTVYNYQLLKQLDNVEMVNMHTNSFELIDNSLALATIKGTATVEAYIRKKPVIIFGKSNLKLPGVHPFRSIDALQAFINDVVDGKIEIDNVIDNLTESCHKVAVSGILQSPEEDIDYSFRRDIRENASYKLLTKLLKHKLN